MHTKQLSDFEQWLAGEEKSRATVEKYLRDVRAFCVYAGRRRITKSLTVSWKESLMENGYTLNSVNSMIAGLNRYLDWLGASCCKLKSLRAQHETYSPAEKELTKSEYLRLLTASKKDSRMHLLLQTICGTGIRVSELQFFTVESVRRGEIIVRCKNKTRRVLLPGKLKEMLLNYARKNGLTHGPIFVTRTGKPMDRSNIWAAMKKLCDAAGVLPSKVFPHNLRKLFARTFYELDKDLAKLADLLGHSSINTTRIYIMTTGTEHRRKLERLGLLL